MKHVLIEIKSLIQDPTHWTQDVHARDKDGHPVQIDDPDACKFCLDGAIAKTTGVRVEGSVWITTNTPYNAIRELIDHEVERLYGDCKSYVTVNDLDGHDAVMEILDHAIELAQ